LSVREGAKGTSKSEGLGYCIRFRVALEISINLRLLILYKPIQND